MNTNREKADSGSGTGRLHIADSLLRVFDRRDISMWEHEPQSVRPIFGVYHVYCVKGWQRLVERQVENLKSGGLLDATERLFVSCISQNEGDIDELRRIIGSEKMELVSFTNDAHRYEYPALEKVLALCREQDCLVYYFHTKGISYQTVDTSDRLFRGFQSKIEAWREMLEYFVFAKWRVAVNVLSHDFDLYGCYRWPPRNYKMFSGNFWWVNSDYGRHLPDFDPDVIKADRFYSEVWTMSRGGRVFSPFETIADLYFVRMRRSIYASPRTKPCDAIAFVFTYNWRKFLKHAFGYSYKKRCQARFQKLK
ncbi:MAG: hypothetical protein SOZ80_07705 [Prevotella sp.]|uniref:hypothetical protein n=1 Tax=Prevotella sp. TaxID=59823 RepID=UPI002A310CFD|nr:hypothetical protein [Prevotella sp.]MDD7317726.1 hypothetical protein [Prevotellaceae bacterium]MDY4020641.1 hypothetical protein [Prevotella sp.]